MLIQMRLQTLLLIGSGFPRKWKICQITLWCMFPLSYWIFRAPYAYILYTWHAVMLWRADSVMIERGSTVWLGGGTGPTNRGRASKFSRTVVCTHCGQLILRKISKYDATRCQILTQKCTKFDFYWGSAPDPAGGAYSAPRTSSVFKGVYL